VDLSNNVIGNEGCDKMAQVLKVCPNIISINLSNNNIGSDGL
jgi:Ran GTPase-activating protein (RanGAP) involved in mRNA processing and transport